LSEMATMSKNERFKTGIDGSVPQGDSARQAVDSLRGYAYQVTTAALAWLDLDIRDRLFLEVAEDYAVVIERAIKAVQVKDSESTETVTLNTDSVRKAVANFVTLVAKNPDVDVQLRYFTTSGIGTERAIDERPDGVAGLTYWRAAAAGADVQPLRLMLESNRFSSEVQEFAKTRDDVALRADMLCKIHWDCGKPGIAALREEFRDRLIVFGRDIFRLAAPEATRLADILIYRVLEKSIEKDPANRVLTRADLYSAVDNATRIFVPRQAADMLTLYPELWKNSAWAGPDRLVEGNIFPPLKSTTSRTAINANMTDRLARPGTSIFTGACDFARSHLANGFARLRSLADPQRFSQQIGVDRNAPFFALNSRNDAHQAILEALDRSQLDYVEGGPIVMLGEQKHAILPALVLLLEQMNFKERPGLILIETEAPTRQDTVLQGAIEKLGVSEIVDNFRALDLREGTIPMSLGTSARWWSGMICDALPIEIAQRLEQTGWRMALELSAEDLARGRQQIFGSKDFPTISFYEVNSAAAQLAAAGYWPNWLSEATQWQVKEIGRVPPVLDAADRDAVMALIDSLNARNFQTGPTGEHESRTRPFVVLFSRRDSASEVLAGVIHSYFYWRDVSDRDNRAPILYLSDNDTPYAPKFLSFGDHTGIVNGLSEIPVGNGPGEFYGYKNALRAVADSSGLQFMGIRVPMA
jgi:hypothetical protein